MASYVLAPTIRPGSARRSAQRRMRRWLLIAAAGAAQSACGQASLSITTPVFPITPVGQSSTQNATVTVTGSYTAVFNSIAITPGFPDFSVGTISGCVIDGSTTNIGGTVCTIPVTFAPTRPGNSTASVPISRSAPLVINDMENGDSTPLQYVAGLSAGATMPLPVVVPGVIADIVGNDQAPAGSMSGFAGDGGPPSGAVFNNPTSMAVDDAGNIYISDTGNCVVRRIDRLSQTVSTVAGIAPSPTPNCGSGVDYVAATSTMLSNNAGIALDSAGNLYIVDSGNAAIRVVSAASGMIYTIAGTLNSPGPAAGFAFAQTAQLSQPQGIAIDGAGNIFITDTGNDVVREVSNSYISVIAGVPGQQGTPAFEATGGAATSFLFAQLQSVAVDSLDNVYVSDLNSAGVYRIDAPAQTISALSSVTGMPTSLAFDASDTLHLTQQNDCNVYKLPAGAISQLAIAGNATCDASGDGSSALLAGLNDPLDVVVDGSGSFYILEGEGVRFVDSSGVTPIPAAFGSVTLDTPSATRNVLLFDGDVATPMGSTPNPLGVFYSGTSTPFSTTTPAAGQDCSMATSSVSIAINPGRYCSLSFIFTPTADSTFNASTSLSEILPAGKVTQTIQLSGTGTGNPPTATLSPGSAQLTAGINGGTASAAFTLTNTGDGTPLIVKSITFGDAGVAGFSEANTCTSPLAQGTSCGIIVTYAPTSVNSVSQMLVITDDTAAGQHTASVTGTGVQATATLAPASENFASIVQETTDSHPFTLTNTSSSASLGISNIAFFSQYMVGYVPGFTQTSNCPLSLPAESSCTIMVTFGALSVGTVQQTLIVTDDSAAGTHTATLSGTGTAPVASVTAGPLTFSTTQTAGTHSAAQTVAVSNTGGAPLSLSGVALGGTNPEDFTVDASACPTVLPAPPTAGSSCNILVTFRPLTSGSFSASLYITDDSGGQRAGSFAQQSVAMSGSSPAPVQASTFTIANTAFAAIPVGQNETQTVNLTLTSPTTVLKSIAIASGFNDYSVGTITGCVVDGATASALNTVCSISITFAPTLAGAMRNAPLIVTTIENGQPVSYVFGLTGISNGSIAALTPGIVSTYLAGTEGGSGGTVGGFGHPATQASLGFLNGQAMDAAGNLYVSDNLYAVIYKITPDGQLSLFAGIPFTPGGNVAPQGGDGGAALNAHLGYPGPLAVDTAGNVYLGATDIFGHVSIRRIDIATGIISTYVGGGTGCPAQTDTYGDGCLGTQYQFSSFGSIGGMAFDASGNFYFNASTYVPHGSSATVTNYGVNRIDAATKIVSVAAGVMGTTIGTGADGGTAIGAAISPGAMTFDNNGNLLVVDGGVKVRKVDAAGTISTIAGIQKTPLAAGNCNTGAGAKGVTGDGSLATAAGFGAVSGIAVDPANDIYLVDNAACEVRRIDSGTGIITTVAGQNSSYGFEFGNLGDPFLNTSGSAALASFKFPQLISLDGSANMYIGGQYDVRKIDVSSSVQDFDRAYGVEGIGSSTGPLTTTVLNAGNSGPLLFQSPFIDPLAYNISTPDFTRDVATTDCVASVSGLNPGNECPVNIDFTPEVAGAPVTDTETINDSGTGPTQTITLIGDSSGTASITLLPHLLSFFSVPNVTSASQSFTLTNNSGVAVPISNITVLGSGATSFAQTNTCGASLAANSSCTIAVTFTPIALGNYLAQVTVSDTVGGYPASQSGGLVGLGGTPALKFVFAADSINPGIFGNQQVGTTSSPHVLTLLSYGNIPVQISAISLTGTDAAQFAIAGTTCGATLAPDATCTVSVTFSPLSNSPGNPPTPFSAAVSVTDNAADSPQSGFLSGYGIGGGLTLNITEAVHLDDAPALNEELVLNIAEVVHVTDGATLPESLLLNITEAIHVTDAVVSAPGKIAQAISFTPLASPVLVSASPITLNATATSGLGVVFSVLSGPGSINGDLLNITGPGSITIGADQPGDTTYAAAPEVTQTVVAESLPVIITFAKGTLPMGTPSSPVGILVTFPVAATLQSLNASTLGAPGSDFTVVSGGSCSIGSSYTAGQTCTVMVTFTPTGPGVIVGQLQVVDTNGVTQFTANLASVRYR